MLRRVSEVLQQQRTVLERAGTHAESLTHIAHGNAAVTEQLAANAEELQQSAARMHASVERFRVR